MSIFGYAVLLGSTWEYALVYVMLWPLLTPNRQALTYVPLQYYQHLSEQWRHCWRYLDVSCCLRRHVLRYAFDGRNGLHVSTTSSESL